MMKKMRLNFQADIEEALKKSKEVQPPPPITTPPPPLPQQPEVPKPSFLQVHLDLHIDPAHPGHITRTTNVLYPFHEVLHVASQISRFQEMSTTYFPLSSGELSCPKIGLSKSMLSQP
jgi:hypothetical protein